MNKLFKLNPKSRFFEGNTKESQKIVINENLVNDDV